MKNLNRHLLPLVIGLVFATVIWQVGEIMLADFWSKTCISIFGSAFVELPTMDKNGIPMRYYPSAGKVYDPELIAYESSRFYKPALRNPGKMPFCCIVNGWKSIWMKMAIFPIIMITRKRT